MRARRIIEGAAFGPDVLRAASAAFDAAWAEIADCFDPTMRDEARERLAISIISAARGDSTDADLLRRVGLGAMARSYPHHLNIPPDQPSADASGTDD
jgi:glycosyltransferase A (GT-A) superfamily protein (DUF2064 family)